jgi:methyltransferase family protein
MGPEPDKFSDVPGMHIWGWMSPTELTWLGEQAATMDSVVEIGSLHGRSAYALAKACPGPVYCIDPWDDEHDLCYDSFLRNVSLPFPNVVPIRGRSPQVLDTFFHVAPDMIDMVFIDGDHEYESVIADINAWTPLTRKLICGHDYQNEDGGYPGVAKAVDEIFDGRVEVAPDTAIWTVRL